MAKIPFSIDYRPQIESGEYKVVTSFGEPAEIVKWDCKGQYPLLACIFDGNTDDAAFYTEEGKGMCNSKENYLFIVTPEPELSEFEERIFKLLRQYKECDIPLTPENIKADASMLWMDFEKYFFDLYGKEGEGDSALRSFYYRGLADGKAEALKNLPRWMKEQGEMELTGYGIIGVGVVSQENPRVYLNGHSIDLYSLEKLPGFNE